jgi:hypothetical protein
LPETDLLFDELTDPRGIRFWPEDKGRDGCRSPIPWDEGEPPNGFTSGKPWLPIKSEASALNVASQNADPDSVLNFYRLALSFRKGHSALIDGDIEFFKVSEPVLAFRRANKDESLVCIYNLSPDTLTVKVEGDADIGLAQGIERLKGKLTLHANGWAIFTEHSDNPLRIEVHPRISEELPFSHVDITSTIWPADARPGINRYASLAALMRHNLLHAAGNMRARVLRLVQLHDIASVARMLSSEDWRELLDHRGEADSAWWLYPPLAFAQRYLPGAVPIEVLRRARAACPRLLRWRTAHQDLYQVSWSNPRIEALPGIEWARTPLEAARFARSRVFPSKIALREIADGANNQPGLLSVPW